MTVISRLRDAGFDVYTREDWGTVRPGAYADRAASPSYQLGPDRPYHFLHITVTGDTDLPRDGKAGARLVESFGLSTPPMVSYQMLTTNEGRIFEGQNYRVKGTHTVNDKNVPGFPHDLNRYGYAVALMQNVQDEVTDIQVRAIAACFAAAELENHVERGAPIFPHRKFDWKECPGDKAVARLDEIRRLKDRYVKEGLDDMPTTTELLNAKLNPDVKDSETVRSALNKGADALAAVNTLAEVVDQMKDGSYQRDKRDAERDKKAAARDRALAALVETIAADTADDATRQDLLEVRDDLIVELSD